MFNWLKKHLHPNPENEHRPHLLRTDGVIFGLWIIFLLELVYLVPILGGINRSNFFSSILPSALIDSTNNDRDENRLRRLTYNPVLEEAARLKAKDMAEKGYFAHVSPDGVDPWHWLKEAGYTYTSAGENLAVNFVNSDDIHRAWMNSESHRANILDDRYTEIGIATANGLYKGRESVFVVQFFGKPARKIVVAQPDSVAAEKVSVAKTGNPEVAGTTDEAVFVEVLQPVEPLPVLSNRSNSLERLAVNPKTALADVFAVFFLLVAAALILTMATHHELRHHPSMLNGLILVAVLVGVMVLNQHISVFSSEIF